MLKTLRKAGSKAVENNTWKKFASPTAKRGQTAYPKDPIQQQNLGVRYDYDGEVTVADIVYHKFQMQPNAGAVPSSIKRWREKNGGTHAVMADVLIKKDGTREDVEEGLEKAHSSVQG